MRLLATFGCLLAFGTAAQAAPNDLGVDYSLAAVMDHGALAAMEVRMSFAADADGETKLTLPTEWGGGEKLWRFVSQLKVEGAEAVTDDGPAARIIRSAPRAPIHVSYRLTNPQPTDPPAGGADFGEMRARLLRRELRDARIFRRHFEHADARAVLRRRELDAFLGRLARGAVDAGGALARVPDLEEQRPVLAADARDARRRRVLENDGAALRVVARDDAAERRAQLFVAHVGAPA